MAAHTHAPVDAAAWNPYVRGCPTRELLDRIGDRWTVLVIGTLREGPLRFTAIAHRVDGISQKMLTQTLRALEQDGLVTRTQFPVIPPRVEYELTDLGQSLTGVLDELDQWARTHMAEVLRARERRETPPRTRPRNTSGAEPVGFRA